MPGSRVRRGLVRLALVWAVSIAPLVAVEVPPLVDYPSHLARITIMATWNEVPEWRDFYGVRWRVLPNLAFEVFSSAFSAIFGPEHVGRAFIAATLLLLLGGTVALNQAIFREDAAWPVLSALFFYNWILLYGFLNYLFGIGLALWAIAAWIRLRDRPWLAVATSVAFGLALFFAHLVALGLYAVCISAFEAACAWQARAAGWRAFTRRIGVSGAQFVMPAVLFVALSPTAGEVQTLGFESLRTKALFLVGLIRSGDRAVDLASLALYAAAAGTLLWRASVGIRAPFGLVLAAVAGVFVMAPSHLATTTNLDMRLPVFGCFLFFGVTELRRRHRIERLVLAVLTVGMVARPAILAFEWRGYDAVFDEYRAALREVERGSTVFVAAPASSSVHRLHMVSIRPGSSPYPEGWTPPLRHVATLAILDRPVFVPQVFAHGSQQPLSVHPDFRPLAAFQTNEPLPIADVTDLREKVITMHTLQQRAWMQHRPSGTKTPRAYLLWLSSDPENPKPSLLAPVRRGRGFGLFEITARGLFGRSSDESHRHHPDV